MTAYRGGSVAPHVRGGEGRDKCNAIISTTAATIATETITKGWLEAFGSTIVTSPACSFRLASEDAAMFTSYLKEPGLAYLVQSECQPTTRAASKALVEWQLIPMLCSDAQRLLEHDNAGGSSRISEALSIELLNRAFGARLSKLELELRYWPSNGSITDFSVEVDGTCLGVSVTRAMGAPRSEYTVEAAESLLRKKLSGVLRSTETCCDEFTKQVLHIWAPSERCAQAVERAYERLPQSLIANTVVLVTVCGLMALFTEKSTIKKRACREQKGLKDETHLRVLQESDPMKHNRTDIL